MPRSVKIGLVGLVVATAASTAFAAPVARQHTSRVDCHAKALTFFFWPHGHGAISSIGFSSYLYPHLEVYKSAHGTYPSRNELGVGEFMPNGPPGGGFVKVCTPAAPKAVDSSGATAKTTAATVLKCTFPRNAQLDLRKTKAPKGLTLTATVKAAGAKAPLAVQASIYRAGSKLRFNPTFCKASKPPSS